MRRDNETGVFTSSAVTDGIRITVTTGHLPEQSAPSESPARYAFRYTVVIANEGAETARLRSRHWIITDGNGKVEEVKGPGVVGYQPTLKPGEAFEYTSGSVLETPFGVMRGTYQMERPDGRVFDAKIADFTLAVPNVLN
jgi:ApaG protein